MSFNQSRAEKSEGQLRKSGRSGSSGHPRGFSGGGKGGAGAPPPHSSASNAQALSSSRSFKKSGNVQGGQSRVNPQNTGLDSAAAVSNSATHRAVQNGAHVQAPSHDAPASSAAKPVDANKNSRALPKAPSSNPATGVSNSAALVTPTKGDASKQFTLQFGSISPGIMNGIQIPARTSSAPPNLDEQKRDQARLDSLRAMPTFPLPSVPKPQQPRKDVVIVEHSSPGESHPQMPMKEMHVQIPDASVALQKSSVIPVGGATLPVPFPQAQVPLQFGGPSIQMQPQGITASSLQMPLTLPVGGAPQVPQPMFVPGLQSHPLQPQPMMHQGQGFGFAPQIGHQPPPQLVNRGISIGPQFSQQQPAKFGGQRKSAVKITHPETHEELKLDKRTDSYMDGGSSGQRSLPNLTQPQPLPTFSHPHQLGYYSSLQPSSYGPSPIIYSSATSVPMSSSQMSSQGPRSSYSVGPSGQPISFMNASILNPISGGKSGPPLPVHGIPELVKAEASTVPVPSTSVQVSAKPSIGSYVNKVKTPSVMITAPVGKTEAPKVVKTSPDLIASHQQSGIVIQTESAVQQSKSFPQPASMVPSAVAEELPTVPSSAVSLGGTQLESSSVAPTVPLVEYVAIATVIDGKKKESIRRSDSLKDHQKKPTKKELKLTDQQQQQMDILNTGDAIKLSPSKTTKDDSTEVLSMPEHSEGVVAVRTSGVVEDEAMSMVPMSAGVVFEKEATQDAPVNCSDASKLNVVTVPVLEDDSGKMLTFSTLDESGNLSRDLDYSLSHDDRILGEFGTNANNLASVGSEKNGELNDLLLENSNAKVYPISAVPDIPGHLKPVLSTKQEVSLQGSSKASMDLLHNAEGQELGNCKEEVSSSEVVDGKEEGFDRSDITSHDIFDAELGSTDPHYSAISKRDELSLPDAIQTEIVYPKDVNLNGPAVVLVTDSTQDTVSSESGQKVECKAIDLPIGNQVSATLPGAKDKLPSEPIRTKTVAGKKKKLRDILIKADAAGASDLYNAYKGPEEKHGTASTSESVDDSLTAEIKDMTVEDSTKETAINKEEGHVKAEVDDWEDAADISTPKLRASEIDEPGLGAKQLRDEYGNEASSKKKYSRDFLLTFSELCNQLPIGFEIGSDIANALMGASVPTSYIVDRDPHPSPGRGVDRSFVGSRIDRRMVGLVDDDKWSKLPGSFSSGQDLRVDIGHGVSAMNFRPGQGINHGVLRNPRGQSSSQYTGGILSGPLQTMPSPGGVQRSGADADRWQRAAGVQRGLIPAPQTPMQVMHKATRKYEIGKVSDEEDAKQRQIKAILNKLTPQNFEKLFAQVKEVDIDNPITLTGVISQIFDKALMEPTFCEMYANFCLHLAAELRDFSENNEKITFKRLLLNKCQEEFERGEREQAEANKAEEEGEIQQSEEEREEKRIKARRRMLGNIRLIGELYKKKMLTERIMHECIKKLLSQYPNPDEEDIEALCKLMSTIGEMIDHPKAKEHMDAYFDMMLKLSGNQKLSSRVRFMLKDAIDLRRNKWQQRRKVEGPKKIEEVHRDAAHERQAQASRLARGPVISSTPRRGAPTEYGSRGSTILASPASQQIGGSRGFPTQARGYGGQDVRLEDRHLFESRGASVPLPQRPTDEDSITLGPQGGLARGMSIRGQSLALNAPSLVEVSSNRDPRRGTSGSNGYASAPYYSREVTSRHIPDRPGAAQEPPSLQDRRSYTGFRDSVGDHSSDKSSLTVPSTGRIQGSVLTTHSAPFEPKPLSEEGLRDKSISAIREYYSAKDEEEVAMCIRELNSPSFYPTMISLWVTDSFERKDLERDLLANLLVKLSGPQDSLLNQLQLSQGFESVLSSLEDAVNDAPKAAEFLGRLFAKVILENVLPLREVGRLIHEGGEEPGRLLEVGLASEVLGSILEFIKLEKGDSILNEIRTNSSLRLEDFRPPHPMKAKKLDAFL